MHVDATADGATTLNPMLAGMSVGGGGGGDPPRPQQPRPVAQKQLSLGSVGVAGVLKREEQRAAETEQ